VIFVGISWFDCVVNPCISLGLTVGLVNERVIVREEGRKCCVLGCVPRMEVPCCGGCAYKNAFTVREKLRQLASVK
jgi:hypothetical protein